MFTFISVVNSRPRMVLLVIYLFDNGLSGCCCFQQEVVLELFRVTRGHERSRRVTRSREPRARQICCWQTACTRQAKRSVTCSPAFLPLKLWGSDVVFGTPLCPPGASQKKSKDAMPCCHSRATGLQNVSLLTCWL